MTPAALKILFLDGIGTPIYILQHIYEEILHILPQKQAGLENRGNRSKIYKDYA